jgi:hypothetical protein
MKLSLSIIVGLLLIKKSLRGLESRRLFRTFMLTKTFKSMSESTKEIWKDVVGHEGLYQVSNLGNIKSHQPRWRQSRILKQKNPARYCMAALAKDKKITYTGVHRIVLLAFCYREDHSGLYVNHKNGIKTDNRLENLEWCTAKENIEHAFRIGLMTNRSRVNGKNAKLTNKDIPVIRKLLSEGKTHEVISKIYSVHRNLISGISRGERWKHVAIIIFCVLFSSCTPAAKLRRAKKLISQAEASGLTWKSDTVFKNIEIIMPEVKFDTIIQHVDFRDTILITKDRIITRVKINTVERDVFVETKCPEKIVVKKVPYTVTREIKVGYSLMGVVWRCAVSSLILAAIVFGLCKLRII